MHNPLSVYPGNVTHGATGFPYGRPRNKQFAGDASATPLEAAWVADVFGLLQALLTLGGDPPNGSPESTQSSQILRSLRMLVHSQMFAPFTGVTWSPVDMVPSYTQPGFTDTTGWKETIYNNAKPAFRQIGTVANYIVFPIPNPLPGRLELHAARCVLRGADGHAAVPEVKPRLQVLKADAFSTGTHTELASQFDTQTTTTNYQNVHGVIANLAQPELMTAANRYYLKVTGESGANSLSHLHLIDLAVSYRAAPAYATASTVATTLQF